jgi:hypothetical protein
MMISSLEVFAWAWESPISNSDTSLCLALGCTVLSSLWCQSGVHVTPIELRLCALGYSFTGRSRHG